MDRDADTGRAAHDVDLFGVCRGDPPKFTDINRPRASHPHLLHRLHRAVLPHQEGGRTSHMTANRQDGLPGLAIGWDAAFLRT